MKLLGIDYGRRRIGLAVTDEDGCCVRGLSVIDRKKVRNCTEELVTIISTEKPAELVFGLPLDIDDQETVMSREVRSFAAQVQERTGLPVHFIDESFTSQKAAQLMLYRKKKERRDKSLSDRIAACLILQTFLEDRK